MAEGFKQGELFIKIPVSEEVAHLARESGYWDAVWEKVERMAASALRVPKVQVVQTLVECFLEHHLGQHPAEECIDPESIHLRYYVFQAA